MAHLKKIGRTTERVKKITSHFQLEYTAAFYFFRLMSVYADARIILPGKAKKELRLPFSMGVNDLGRKLFSERTIGAHVFDKRTGKRCGEITLAKENLRVLLDFDLPTKEMLTNEKPTT
ncbi:MAG TPA: hypothetical protein PLB89_05330 [Flavobacteriales bacterium]|nr:hypothetical protein [Flavobacteriales bacterium]